MTSPLSENLKSLRHESGLKQSELAEILEISEKSWSNYERGANEPDIETLLRIANYFDVSVDSMIGRDISMIAKELVSGNLKSKKRVSKNHPNRNLISNPKGNLTLNEPTFNYATHRMPKVISTDISG